MAELSYQISTAARKKRTLRIPESHTLYLCPNSCARRQGIRALRNGLGDHASFLRFSQADVVTGAYEQQAIDAVGRLMDSLQSPPRVISLYVNCIDDFLGTDVRALVEELERAHPTVRFVLSRINPIAADVRDPNAQTIHAQLYDLLEPAECVDSGITLLGNFESIPMESEFYSIVRDWGLGPMRQLFSCETFSEYERLAQSSVAISLSHLGDKALARFSDSLGACVMKWHATYDIARIAECYKTLLKCAGHAPLEGGSAAEAYMLEEHSAADARYAVECALRAAEGVSVAVDSSASMRPFTLALELLGYGFDVRAVFALHVKGRDDEAKQMLVNRYPHVIVVDRNASEALVGSDVRDASGGRPWLAVGGDAAFVLETPLVVDMYHDEGHFGYQGVTLLMRKIVTALREGNDGNRGMAEWC